jgi:hypothetical protein
MNLNNMKNMMRYRVTDTTSHAMLCMYKAAQKKVLQTYTYKVVKNLTFNLTCKFY